MSEIKTFIQKELEVFNPYKADAMQLAESAKGIEISGVDDVLNYEICHKKRMELLKFRTGVEKQTKLIRASIKEADKYVIDKEKELLDITTPVEKDLKAKQDAIDSQKEAIKQAEIERQNKINEERKNKLLALNMRFDGSNFTYNGFITTFFEIKLMSDIQFSEIINSVSEIIAEENRLKAEAEAKAKAEKEAEEKRLAEIKAENERIAKEQAEKQAEINRQLAEIQAEKDRIEKEKQSIIDAENKRKADEQRKLDVEIAEQKRIAQEKIDKENARIADELKAIKDKEEKEAEARRQAELAPDKEKILLLANNFVSVLFPTLTTAQAKELLKTIAKKRSDLYDFIVSECQKL